MRAYLHRFDVSGQSGGYARTPIPPDFETRPAELLGVTRTDVERVVLEGHARRKRNTGAADWLVREGRLMVAYNHPHREDAMTAFVVTLWRRP
jgi:hypothetical protein